MLHLHCTDAAPPVDIGRVFWAPLLGTTSARNDIVTCAITLYCICPRKIDAARRRRCHNPISGTACLHARQQTVYRVKVTLVHGAPHQPSLRALRAHRRQRRC